MPFFSFNDSKYKEVVQGVRMRSAHLEKAMLTFFELDAGASVPAHSHPHEQITLVLEGELEFTMEDETRILKKGDGVSIPPNIEHKAAVPTHPVKVVDAWYPVRKDYVIE